MVASSQQLYPTAVYSYGQTRATEVEPAGRTVPRGWEGTEVEVAQESRERARRGQGRGRSGSSAGRSGFLKSTRERLAQRPRPLPSSPPFLSGATCTTASATFLHTGVTRPTPPELPTSRWDFYAETAGPLKPEATYTFPNGAYHDVCYYAALPALVLPQAPH